MIIDQLPSVGTPALTDETVTEQGQNLFKVTWQRLLTLFKANTTPADIGAVDSAGAAAAAPVQSVNGMTGAVTIPSAPLSDDNPQPLGTASPGTSTNVSRADHVHAMPSAGDVGAMSKWELLWTNASPTSAFAAQTVALDLSGYDFVMVVYQHWTVADVNNSAFCRIGKYGRLLSHDYTLAYRDYRPETTGIYFNIGVEVATYKSSNVIQNASAVIPLQIYGIKGVVNT